MVRNWTGRGFKMGVNTLEALDSVVAQARQCIEEQDWETLASIDEGARAVIAEATSAVAAGQLSRESVTERLETLRGLYEKAREAAVTERDALAARIRETSRTQKAAQAYLDNQ